MNGIDGRIAVVTGAGNGIGAACARRLAADGAAVAMLDLDPAAAAEVASEIESQGGRAQAMAVDCTDRAAVEAAFAEIAATLGPVDILVNNVGQSARDKMSDFVNADMAVLDMILDINLKSTILCARQVVGPMQAKGYGRIVNMTSESAVNGSRQTWEYSAAKAAVIGFTRSIAREFAADGITVNAVGPGATATRAMERIPADLLDRIKAGIPAQRLARPDEIASAVAFFSGDQCAYITGQTLLVNGGNWMI